MAAGVTALLRAFFGCGAFRGCRAAFLLRDPFERKFDPAAIVGLEHFDADFLPLFDVIGDIIDALVRDL